MSDSPTQLTSIQIAGYKSIREMAEPLRLGALNVLIGANGSGKSNLLSLFSLLGDAAQGRFQEFVARQGFARALLFVGDRRAERISAQLSFCGGAQYEFTLTPANDDILFFASETISHETPESKSPVNHEFEGPLRESVISDVVEGVPVYPGIVLLRLALQNWRYYHFHDTTDRAAIRGMGEVADDRFLRSDGRNLAAFLATMQSTSPQWYRNIRDTIHLAAPYFHDFVLTPSQRNQKYISLEWTQVETDGYFGPSQLSDGTLRFACLATLLMQPRLPELLVIDEPELGLHPAAIEVLAGLLRSASVKTQIIVSTQSVNLVDQFQPEEIIVADRQEGQSVFRRLDGDSLTSWLEDYSLGELWLKNVIGGRPW